MWDLIVLVPEFCLFIYFKPQAKEVFVEVKTGFRAGRSAIEQIFSLGILCKKYLQHPQNLYYAFKKDI